MKQADGSGAAVMPDVSGMQSRSRWQGTRPLLLE